MIQAGIDLVKRFEGCRLVAYQDGNGIWSIGYGHTGPEVHEGMTCTQEQADAWLAAQVDENEGYVRQECPSATPAQYAAMTSLCYNIGIGNFRGSSVRRFHNDSQFAQAADSFKLWNRIGQSVSQGLIARRAAEADLYAGGTANV